MQPQEELRPGKILLRRLPEQLRRLGLILRNAPAIAIQYAQIALGLGFPSSAAWRYSSAALGRSTGVPWPPS